MKKIITISISLFLLMLNIGAQENLISSLSSTIEKELSIAEYQQSTKALFNLLPTEKNNWLVQYYITFGNIQLAKNIDDKKMVVGYLNTAQKHISIADSLSKNNSEVWVLKAFIEQVSIKINKLKAPKLSKLADEYLDKALELNPNNPRAMFLKGKNIYFMPKVVGGGSNKALPYFRKADDLYKKYINSTFPKWGESQNRDQIKICSK